MLSLARRNNRVQREEVLAAQSFLSEWYGIEYEPSVTEESQQAIDLLEGTPEGESFDVVFSSVFSRHHHVAAQNSLDCLVGSELEHEDLKRYCRSIVNSQVADIDEMRTLLCEQYDICDYQPLEEVAGRHTGSR